MWQGMINEALLPNFETLDVGPLRTAMVCRCDRGWCCATFGVPADVEALYRSRSHLR